MIIEKTEKNIVKIVADEGKIIRRKNTNETFGTVAYLGYSHYINGELLPEPHKDVPEDFEEIDEPIDDNEIQSQIEG